MPTKAELEAQIAELSAKTKAKPAQKTRTVKLPKMVKLASAGVAVGVDAVYTNNLAVYTLAKDGELATKGDGTVKKPKRIPRAAMLAMLDDPDSIRTLCEFDATA